MCVGRTVSTLIACVSAAGREAFGFGELFRGKRMMMMLVEVLAISKGAYTALMYPLDDSKHTTTADGRSAERAVVSGWARVKALPVALQFEREYGVALKIRSISNLPSTVPTRFPALHETKPPFTPFIHWCHQCTSIGCYLVSESTFGHCWSHKTRRRDE